MNKDTFKITLALLVAVAFVAAQFNGLASSNPLPDIDPVVTITSQSQQNVTYSVNTIAFNFTAKSNWDIYPIYYSLDGLDKVAVDNVSIIKQGVDGSKNPIFNFTTLGGSLVLSNLTQGWHNVTVCMVFEKGNWGYLFDKNQNAPAKFLPQTAPSFL
jgi:hypothetical protein